MRYNVGTPDENERGKQMKKNTKFDRFVFFIGCVAGSLAINLLFLWMRSL